ncbi:hypothetical protein DY000_02056654 [Brassica cretica]|uniref:Sm domain-containing protein n=1 Tax=Brassica cretica TaxID=69181 RepID=A0ABQ7A6S9_BRACR|nr:hypothetical protein DY000_02056654 [Brassica cretica]
MIPFYSCASAMKPHLTRRILCYSDLCAMFLSRSLQAYYIEFFITNWFLFYYTGILACLDGYMNIAMGQTEEYVNGQLKNKYGDAFIRVLCISTVNRPLADGA